MKESKKLRRSLVAAALALLAGLFSVSAATFAWYVYNTSGRTTRVEMLAGSSVDMRISNRADGEYKSTAVMEPFEGLLNPVSTNRIVSVTEGGTFVGFQRAEGFEGWMDASTGTSRVVAVLFGKGQENVDYHKASLYLKTTSDSLDIYLSDIGFTDVDSARPLSTALRLGIVTDEGEAIFEVSGEHDENRGDNADKMARDGYVLDSTKTDGSQVPFTPLTSDNFCIYDKATGAVTLKPGSRKLCTVKGDGKQGYGDPVKVDIYLWLEGCDPDCTMNVSSQTLESLTLSFAGYSGEGA